MEYSPSVVLDDFVEDVVDTTYTAIKGPPPQPTPSSIPLSFSVDSSGWQQYSAPSYDAHSAFQGYPSLPNLSPLVQRPDSNESELLQFLNDSMVVVRTKQPQQDGFHLKNSASQPLLSSHLRPAAQVMRPYYSESTLTPTTTHVFTEPSVDVREPSPDGEIKDYPSPGMFVAEGVGQGYCSNGMQPKTVQMCDIYPADVGGTMPFEDSVSLGQQCYHLENAPAAYSEEHGVGQGGNNFADGFGGAGGAGGAVAAHGGVADGGQDSYNSSITPQQGFQYGVFRADTLSSTATVTDNTKMMPATMPDPQDASEDAVGSDRELESAYDWSFSVAAAGPLRGGASTAGPGQAVGGGHYHGEGTVYAGHAAQDASDARPAALAPPAKKRRARQGGKGRKNNRRSKKKTGDDDADADADADTDTDADADADADPPVSNRPLAPNSEQLVAYSCGECRTGVRLVFPTQGELDEHTLRVHKNISCLFAFAGCTERFSKSNEWKRHVASLHLRTQVWNCALCHQSRFPRKDLYMQHLWRMHSKPVWDEKRAWDENRPKKRKASEMQGTADAQGAAVAKGSAAGESEALKLYRMCNDMIVRDSCVVVRTLPTQWACHMAGCTAPPYTDNPDAWNKSMDHLIGHYRKNSAATADAPPNPGLVAWAARTGVIEPCDTVHGGWKLVDKERSYAAAASHAVVLQNDTRVAIADARRAAETAGFMPYDA